MEDMNALIKRYLMEDVGSGDHSSLSCIDGELNNSAKLISKDSGVLAGTDVARVVYHEVDPKVDVQIHIKDGMPIHPGDLILTIEGSAQSILKGERLMLNCMQRMSGIATYTRHLCDLISHTKTRLLDTRKTTPGFRLFEKAAVVIGGGVNHRFGLYDMIMLKDNHIDYAGGVEKAINKTRHYLNKHNLDLKIEIECRSLEELNEILKVGDVDRIMLDNFETTDLRKAVEMINARYETEASGGITEETIASYAECGVDYISVGALTHQIKSLDMSLKASSA